jgi:hypothetical protein
MLKLHGLISRILDVGHNGKRIVRNAVDISWVGDLENTGTINENNFIVGMLIMKNYQQDSQELHEIKCKLYLEFRKM